MISTVRDVILTDVKTAFGSCIFFIQTLFYSIIVDMFVLMDSMAVVDYHIDACVKVKNLH